MKKLNWGHGLLIAIIVMILAVLTLVFKTVNQKIELVTEDYYPKELKYEEEIQKKKLTENLKDQVLIEVSDSVSIHFPADFEKPELIKGEIWFYKASNMVDDLKDSIRLADTYQVAYPVSKLATGKYDVIIDWSYNESKYYYKTSIFIEKN